MVPVRRRLSLVAAAIGLSAMCLVVSGTPSHAVATVSTKITGTLSGRTSGRILAILPSGSTARSSISSAGKFTLTLPKSSSTLLKVTLQVVNADGSYAGPISIGKKPKATSTFYSWYGAVSVPKGVTTALPTMTWSSSSNFGYVKLALTSRLTVGNVLRGVNGLTGKPAGAGRLGLSSTRARSASAGVAGIWASGAHAAVDSGSGAGDDLDGDGIPNSLDIDDDGDGYPDPVDPSSSSSSSTPTSQFDTINDLGTSVEDNVLHVHNPINYNILRDTKPVLSELMAELSLLDDANIGMWIRAVAPFFSDTGSKMLKDAWVDCTGLGWCLTADTGDTADTFVSAPRLNPFGDGRVGDIWKYAFTNHSGSACDIHIPSIFTSDPSKNNCKPVKWGQFSQKQWLQDALDNGSPDVTTDAINWAASHTGGFGLYDPYVLTPCGSGQKNMNCRGFDLGASVSPRGYTKFLENFEVGDVFYINATLDDGTAAKIAMTVSPFFQTAPTIFSFQAAGDSNATVLDYTTPENCTGTGDPGCRYGNGRRPVMVSSSNPVLTLKFWRPQRQRVEETDGTAGLPFLDMGGLNYRISLYSDSAWFDCPNSSTSFSDTDSSTFTSVASGGMSNEHEFMRDPQPDKDPSQSRFITLTVQLNQCVNFMNRSASLDVSDKSTRFGVRLEADSEPKFGGNRSSTNQGFALMFK